MTLELADRSITHPKGLAEDVFVKVGSFHFPTNFVVVDFKADPRVPLILGRSFLRIGRALIDVYEGELILRDGDEQLIFHVDKHPQKHANESIKMINSIDVSCKDSFGEMQDLYGKHKSKILEKRSIKEDAKRIMAYHDFEDHLDWVASIDFDDLYNNLKVYEHELKGVSNSSSPNIAFMSTEVKGSTLKQRLKSYVPSFLQQASMPTTHMIRPAQNDEVGYGIKTCALLDKMELGEGCFDCGRNKYEYTASISIFNDYKKKNSENLTVPKSRVPQAVLSRSTDGSYYPRMDNRRPRISSYSPLNQVDTFYNGLNENDQDSLNAAAGGNLLSKTTREALNIIENKSKVRYSRNKLNVSRMNTTFRESVSKMDERIDKLADQLSTLVEIVSKKLVTPAPVKAVEEICVTCSGPHAWYNCPNTDNNQSSVCAATGSTAHIPPPVNPIPIPEPDVPKTLPKPNIPYPSRRNDQKSREKASNLMEKIFQIFQDLRFDISFADALLLMPRFAPTIRNLLMNKEKLLELSKIPLNENCLAMLLKKLPDLGASINLMPLSIWKKLSLPELTQTRMTLELADRSITHPKGLAEDVFVKVGSFHFPTDFVVVDFEADPRHPQKHANELIKMINFIDFSCEDSFGEVLRLKKSNHFLSGSTTPLSDSSPSLTSFETRDSLLEEFADELALLDPFPPKNEDVDVEAELREIEWLLNRDLSTNFSTTIMIDHNLEKFTDEFAPACLPPPGDDESFLKEDVQEENFQVYSNPLFEFDDNYNSSNINPLFKEMLEDVESKDSNVSNFDEPVLLNTPLFDEDECFDPGGDNDEIDACLAIKISTYIKEGYYDSEGDVFYLERLLIDDTTHNLFPEVLFDHEPQCFKDESELDTLKNMVKVFDSGIWEKTFSPSYVRLSSKDHHYLFFTIVVQILFTHHVNFLFSFGSEDTIFDPGIFAFHFSSQEPVAVKCSMEFCSSTCFIPKDE
ncbi:reverse transcriptase domain-containing protein [Tanacetum coccineum]